MHPANFSTLTRLSKRHTKISKPRRRPLRAPEFVAVVRALGCRLVLETERVRSTDRQSRETADRCASHQAVAASALLRVTCYPEGDPFALLSPAGAAKRRFHYAVGVSIISKAARGRNYVGSGSNGQQTVRHYGSDKISDAICFRPTRNHVRISPLPFTSMTPRSSRSNRSASWSRVSAVT
jgi:hypothetical protein